METYQKLQTENDEDDDVHAHISQIPSSEGTRSTTDASNNNIEPDHYDSDVLSGNDGRRLDNGESFEDMSISKGSRNQKKRGYVHHRYASPQRLDVASSQDEWPVSGRSDFQSSTEEDAREIKGVGSSNTDGSSIDGLVSRQAKSFRMLSQHESFSSDDGDDLGRFSFDFNHALGNLEIEDEYFGGGDGDGQRCNDEIYIPHHVSDPNMNKLSRNPIISSLKRFLHTIKRARTQSRQKRIERLLSLQDKDSYSSKCNFYSSRVELCLSSPWCDLLDKGFILVMIVIFIFVTAYLSLDEEEDRKARKFLLAIGIPIIVFRVVWRPLYWILWGRIQERVSYH